MIPGYVLIGYRLPGYVLPGYVKPGPIVNTFYVTAIQSLAPLSYDVTYRRVRVKLTSPYNSGLTRFYSTDHVPDDETEGLLG